VRTVRPAQRREPDPATPAEALVLVPCIGPHQITWVDDVHVVVTYPVGSDTVLSAQPDGTWRLMPAGTQGPYERARLLPDRLVYAPLGAAGTAYLLPYVDRIPNA